MKYIKSLLAIIVISLLISPPTAHAAFAVGWSATSTATSWISPNLVNGVEQSVRATQFIATSTSLASYFNLVGIGSTSPSAKLTVAGTTQLDGMLTVGSTSPFTVRPNEIAHFVKNIDGYAGITCINRNSGLTASCDVLFNNDQTDDAGTAHFGDIGLNGSRNADPLYTGLGGGSSLYDYAATGNRVTAIASSSATSYIGWLTGGLLAANEKMRLTNGGNLGIGTTTPITKLTVEDATGGTTGSRLTLSRSDTAVAAGDEWGSLEFFGNDLSGGGAGVHAKIVGYTTDAATNFGNLGFFTGVNSVAGMTERLTVTAAGNVGIGTTTPTEKLTISGKLKIVDETIETTSITFEGTTAAGLKLSNSDGYISLTPINSSWAHIYSDRSYFIFNKPVWSIGGVFSSYYGGDLTLQTGGSARMTVANAGSVGIGDTVPDALLDIASSTATMMFRVDDSGDGDTTPFVIDGNGNVGIGTSSPARQLHLEGVSGSHIRIQRTDSATANGTIEFTGNDSVADAVIAYNNSIGSALTFNTGGASLSNVRMIIDSTGLVGIGTTSPYAKLSVVGQTVAEYFTATSTIATSTFTNATFSGNVGVGTSSPTAKLHIQGVTGSANALQIDGKNGAGPVITMTNSGTIFGYVGAAAALTTGAATDLALRSQGSFYLSTGGGSARMTVSSTGLVGIGTTSPYAKLSVVGQTVAEYFTATSTTATSTFAGGTIFNGKVGIATSSPSGVLSVQGSVFLNGLTSSTAGNAVCQLTGGEIVNAGNTTCLTSSKRFKTDIEDIDVGLKEVLAMKPRSYTRTQPTPSMPSGKEVGLIAEEVNEIVPRLVEYEADGVTPRGVNYQEYTAVLTKAIQEQQKQIDELKAMQGGMPQSESKKYQVILTMILVAGSAFLIGKLTNTLKK